MASYKPLSSIYDNPTELLKNADDASRMVCENWWYSDREVVDPQRDPWDEVYKMYRGYQEIDDDDVMSNFHVPDTWAMIESYVPRVAGARPRIEVWEAEPNDADLARMHRGLIFYGWRRMRVPMALIPFVKSGLVFGAAVWRVRHRKEVGIVSVRESVGRLEEMRLRLREQMMGVPPGSLPRAERFADVEQVIYDDPVLEQVDLDRLYPHPDATSIEDAELRNLWMIDEQPGVEFSQIEAEAKAQPDLYDAEAVRKLGKMLSEVNPYDRYSGEHRLYLKSRQLQTFGPQQEPTGDGHLRQVTLLRQQTRHKMTVVVKEFPDLPPLINARNRLGMIDLVLFTPIPDPLATFYGQSLAEILYSPNLEKDALHNARMDRILGSIAPMFGVLRGQGPAPSQIRWRPWGTIPMDGPEDLWTLNMPEMNLSAYREAAEIDQSMQRAAAADQFMGVGGSSSGTATEASMLYQSAGTKAGLMYHILSAQALERMGRLLIRINELHKSRPQIVRITGANVARGLSMVDIENLLAMGVPPEQMKDAARRMASQGEIEIDPGRLREGFGSEPDLVLDVSSTEPMTRQFRLQRAINALQVAGQIPPEGWMNPIVREIGIKIMEGLEFENVEALIDQMMAQQQQAAQQQQLTAGDQNATNVPTARPETEGDRLAEDQGGAQGPRLA